MEQVGGGKQHLHFSYKKVKHPVQILVPLAEQGGQHMKINSDRMLLFFMEEALGGDVLSHSSLSYSECFLVHVNHISHFQCSLLSLNRMSTMDECS